ncbi:MAG: protein kinase [Kofleriaceae bacterium]
MPERATVGNRYAIDGGLGEGGMGRVYRARHLQLGKPFALKVISPAFALDSAARARFNEEAKLASEISHPNIVSVVDYGEDPQLGAYMVMELIEGDPLVRPGDPPMSMRRVCDILCQVCDALDHIHRRGIIHGDVKAENILLTAEAGTAGSRRRRIARLLDFGLARRAGGIQEQEVSGSPHYLAPERASGSPPSIAADVYAVGVLGYYMMTGTLPFEGNVVEIMMAHVHEPIPPLASRRGEPVDDAVQALIARAMAKDPRQRHASIAAFRYELNNVMDMLELGRRRRSNRIERPRDANILAAFDRSRMPQALLAFEGRIVQFNSAFAELIGRDDGLEGAHISETNLADLVPGFMPAVRGCHVDGKPHERRARLTRDNEPPLEIKLWFCPLAVPGAEVHLIIKVDEVDPPASS